MTTLFYAQPYQIGVEGFFFASIDDYDEKLPTIKDRYGQQVEEFEIQFINGDDLDAAFAKAWGLSQCNIARFFEVAEGWDDYAKISFIVAVSEAGYSYDFETVGSADFHVDTYFLDTLKDLAIEFVDEGLFGSIPDNIRCYLDYDAIARDLGLDYTEITIAGTRLIYRIS